MNQLHGGNKAQAVRHKASKRGQMMARNGKKVGPQDWAFNPPEAAPVTSLSIARYLASK